MVGVMKRVRLTHLRSKTFELGDIWCWLDDDKKGGTRIVSWWKVEKMCVFFSRLKVMLTLVFVDVISNVAV